MQADYTRKTQEIAELRKLDVDPATAQEALEVFQNLQNPEFQRQLYERLGEVFQEGVESDDLDSEFDDPRDKQLAELSGRLERFERDHAMAQAEAELARADALIRSENPSWGDEDIQSVAQLAIANGGNMLKGAEVYKALQQRIVAAHVDKKASVPATASAPNATGHAEAPQQKFGDLDEAHKAALAYWRSHQD